MKYGTTMHIAMINRSGVKKFKFCNG